MTTRQPWQTMVVECPQCGRPYVATEPDERSVECVDKIVWRPETDSAVVRRGGHFAPFEYPAGSWGHKCRVFREHRSGLLCFVYTWMQLQQERGGDGG